jgi:hypothetical protein
MVLFVGGIHIFMVMDAKVVVSLDIKMMVVLAEEMYKF